MEFGMILILFVASIPTILAEDISYGTIVVDGTTSIAQTDDNFVCATIDWWPHDKCDYKQCPWHYTSAITLDLCHPILTKAIQGSDPKLVSKILDPNHLNKVANTFINLARTVQTHDLFYVLMVLNSALLWHRLMGKTVLAVGSDASPFLRSYAHCSKGRIGVTLLVINLSDQTKIITDVQNGMNNNIKLATEQQNISRKSFSWCLKNTASGAEIKASSDKYSYREEYHLTPKNGYLQTRTMVLNGIPLELTSTGNIPRLDPIRVNVKSPISISPLSIAFIVFPDFVAPACR
ncbi:hypothetical protein PVK06_032918 [Gossypium arboreum]|uniref:Heparanase-like protein 1 n=1 Tax=Gossypium arboreum TaxID=29729 RepID=A0ABR0NVC5_GOSAR|nr:hypothetical protein PVK06_032918 [Gossypium arboreum]